MVRQYNHYLYVKELDGDSVQDEKGNWLPAIGEWKFHSVCREETNGKGTMIQGADGKALVFSSLIQLPKSCARIAEGMCIRVTETNSPEGFNRIEGTVLKFDAGQLHCRIWV